MNLKLHAILPKIFHDCPNSLQQACTVLGMIVGAKSFTVRMTHQASEKRLVAVDQ